MTRAAVLGAGAWGTTFAAVLADAGTDVTLWGRDEAVIRAVRDDRRHDTSLPGIELPAGIHATTDATEALADAELVVIAVPSQRARAILEPFRPLLADHALAVSLMKGIELGTHERMSQVISEVWGLPDDRVTVVSGPNLAREIAERQPTATVVASTSTEAAERVAAATASSYFRPYTNADVVGVELSGAYKNVIAVGVGVADGLGYGHNTTATVITRGLAEITRLGLALGARPETFSGLAGMGDLIATCASPLSRNHTLGAHIGRGASLEDAITLTRGTAEGVKTAQSIRELAASAGVEVPICDGVVRMLSGEVPPSTVVETLLSRPRKAEVG
ncbi:NAD(P)H-dependent glycerol-3-phosphate dehydrogenase [Demequina lignilytica]|uniref:Glycerol-3-phosphate dehydrogenase [NAD(P)+] n=1 Tax=Demequina lignilytica TaxID=3051663 RepID=A0AB35MFF2_9MICO|nr:NAD(P)H-dependent glycerol-3-phosphate dehydrogenase [Demequina sp. SYSU T0a273]MDN4482496.1 NAD(P)H-dependent glycerol-3-phosphate dehydrogenase [Demequina sp. SYSU T0a273]